MIINAAATDDYDNDDDNAFIIVSRLHLAVENPHC